MAHVNARRAIGHRRHHTVRIHRSHKGCAGGVRGAGAAGCEVLRCPVGQTSYDRQGLLAPSAVRRDATGVTVIDSTTTSFRVTWMLC